jgi:hypothetical protein
MEKKMRKK